MKPLHAGPKRYISFYTEMGRNEKLRTWTGDRGPGNGQRATGNGQRATGNGQRATGNGQRATGNVQRSTGSGQRGADSGDRIMLTQCPSNPVPLLMKQIYFIFRKRTGYFYRKLSQQIKATWYRCSRAMLFRSKTLNSRGQWKARETRNKIR